ncbi:hypothetical protein DASC09_044650 [Saccharomycopsis crataegensis]|uniref:S1-like domain-containing protein n=1 Tax=Saccharomycopsis crataegensis TaxID=43959 RepID=A0AAV5QRG9_9ASCO|nr:hypothetical protein DASC09_044650 [Saccharomycopsis crataegensis]
MPKSKGKGGKNKRRGKNSGDGPKRELITKDEGQEYATVTKLLGNGRVEAQCFDDVKRTAHIRGKLRKRVWMGPGDIVLVSLRDFQDDQCDIIEKYSIDEARQLKSLGELPENAKINEAGFDEEEEGDAGFEFGADSDDEDEEEDGKLDDLDIDDI